MGFLSCMDKYSILKVIAKLFAEVTTNLSQQYMGFLLNT